MKRKEELKKLAERINEIAETLDNENDNNKAIIVNYVAIQSDDDEDEFDMYGCIFGSDDDLVGTLLNILNNDPKMENVIMTAGKIHIEGKLKEKVKNKIMDNLNTIKDHIDCETCPEKDACETFQSKNKIINPFGKPNASY